MSERHKFVETMQRAMDDLKVKASLAKLELGEVKDEWAAVTELNRARRSGRGTGPE